MIIALFGLSSSGKTTIANILKQRLGGCPTRHCGKVVQARARDLRLWRQGLPDEVHREIDAETRSWCEGQLGLAIVEGRYLHCVLSRTSADVRLIELICDQAERARRSANRAGRALATDEFRIMDTADRDFTAKMFPGLSPLIPGLRVDTTLANANTCVMQILNWIGRPGAY